MNALRIMRSAEYEAFVAESQVQQVLIDDLKKENAALSRTAAFYKSEAEKAQREIQRLNAELKKTVDNLESQKSGFISQIIDMYSQIDKLEEKNDKLLRENEKLKTSKARTAKGKQPMPTVVAANMVLNVDAAIDNLKMAEVKVDEDKLVAIETDPEPPLKRKYDFSEKCLRGDYIAFDLETTGLSPKTDYIIELTAVRFRDFKPVSAFSTLINPIMVDIPSNITRITGIDDSDVLGAPMIQQVMQSFTEFIGDDDMVGHNIRAFDLKFLYRFGFEMDESPRNYYDTLSMARKLIPEGAVENNKLETLLDYFGITRRSAHKGLTDSVAEGMLFGKLLSLK